MGLLLAEAGVATDHEAVESLRGLARPLSGGKGDYDALLEMIGDAHFVLIGEASHGTHEFYQQRAEITKRLIAEKGFNAVAVEADWPDAYRVNRYVRGEGDDREAVDSLADFTRFPTWMWRNADVLDFVGWLRDRNEGFSTHDQKVGFYGVDLYSLFTSIRKVIEYLDQVDPEAARRARERYSCFDHFAEDSQAYGYAAGFGMSASCEDEVVAQLFEMKRKAADYVSRDGHIPPDEAFFAEQNARLITNAEKYYRFMFAGRVSTWNLRDRHMADTINALADHLRGRGAEPRLVVWEHNSHLGDARATGMGAEGELNVGQLMRERHGEDDVRLIGFSTYTGTVTAATDWDGPAERKKVRPGLDGSWEKLCHEVGIPDFYLPLRGHSSPPLLQRRLQRAIGVIYRPQTERMSHYFDAILGAQFDALIHFDTTRAVEPLERWPIDHSPEPPETYPSAL